MADTWDKKVYSQFQLELAIRKIGLRGSLSRDGKGKYSCPFHKDKTPSMYIDYRHLGYNCFSCKKHGTIFSLIRDISGKSIEELLNTDSFDNLFNTLAQPLEVAEDRKEEPLEIRGTILPWRLSPEAKAYIQKRGIPEHIAEAMNMGFMNKGEINETAFYKRLTIPTDIESGLVINMEGRDTTFKASTKVLYPKGALKPIYEHYKLNTDDTLYLVEGLIKLAVLRSDSFFTNSTSTMGSFISPYQEAQLKRFSKVCVILDNDDAGEAFYRRIKNLLTPLGKEVSCIRLRSIGFKTVKDVDEIPTKLGISVEKYRRMGYMEFITP